MFSNLGKIIARGWPVFLAAWVILFVTVRLTAPAWNDIADDHEFGYLPDDAPSRQGEALFHKAFPNELLASNVVLVVHRED
ncbi:MAG TPA: hypothetical protein VNX28_15360, partial [Gemmataceae bacterium]|nr:hypothetical protein [Gemmataceae bacterium]